MNGIPESTDPSVWSFEFLNRYGVRPHADDGMDPARQNELMIAWFTSALEQGQAENERLRGQVARVEALDVPLDLSQRRRYGDGFFDGANAQGEAWKQAIRAALAEPEGGSHLVRVVPNVRTMTAADLDIPVPNEGEWGDDDPPTGDEALRMGWST